MTVNLREFLTFGLQIAAEAESIILPYYRDCSTSRKDDGSEVTDADRAAETLIRRRILDRYPDHGILGEEFGKTNGDSPFEWVVDPIDGTSWFAMGMPFFGTLIALVKNEEPIIGIIRFPALRETVHAAKGMGCWMKSPGRPLEQIHTGYSQEVESAVITSSGPQGSEMHPSRGARRVNILPLIRRARKFKFSGDCIQHTAVCRGGAHAAIDTVMFPWDIAAIVPCVEEAGGVVTDLSGNRSNILRAGSLLSSCSPKLHAELLNALTGSPVETATIERLAG
jgi:histidinol-phosphatase